MLGVAYSCSGTARAASSRRSTRSTTVAAMVRGNDRLKREFPRIQLPVLILHGTLDKAPLPAGSRQFHDQAGSGDKTLTLYEGYFHDLLADVGKEQVMADVQRWMDERL